MFDQRDALRAATRNKVAVYVVSTHGLTTTLGMGDVLRQATVCCRTPILHVTWQTA